MSKGQGFSCHEDASLVFYITKYVHDPGRNVPPIAQVRSNEPNLMLWIKSSIENPYLDNIKAED
jgi:hypothetical protein